MTDYLARLALRSVGDARRVQPLTRPMYAPRREVTSDLTFSERSQEQLVENNPPTSVAPTSRLGSGVEPAESQSSPESNGRVEIQVSDVISSDLVQPFVLSARPKADATVGSTSFRDQVSDQESPSRSLAVSNANNRRPPGDSDALRPTDSVDEKLVQTESLEPSIAATFMTLNAQPGPIGGTNERDFIPKRSVETDDALPAQSKINYEARSNDTRRRESSPGESVRSIVSPPEDANFSSENNSRASAWPEASIRPLDESAMDKERSGPITRPTDAALDEPTIQVTIGRIEVRATPPVLAVRARRSRPPLSLDDYLKHRDGGGGE